LAELTVTCAIAGEWRK